MPDFGEFMIGGIQVMVLVLGIVEAAKQLGITGKGSQILALCLGFVFVAVSSAITAALIPPEWVPYIEIVVKGIGGAIAAMGIFDLLKKLAAK